MAYRLTFIALVGILLIAGGAYFAWSFGAMPSYFASVTGTTDPSYGCTKEARVCSDGTIVTRSGPSCTFAECPNARITDLTPSTTPPEAIPNSQPSTPTEIDPPSAGDVMVACTMDAKQCPDGSYVGRSGPKCEFVCPTTPVSSTVIVNGVVTVGPSCPVMRITDDTKCATAPYVGTIMFTNTSSGQSYSATTNDAGEFTLTIMRGVYDISRPPGSSPFPACSGKIEITAPGGPIPISCDSGIR